MKFTRDGDRLRVVVPPGKYLLGDPCYSFPPNYWMDLLVNSDFFSRPVGHAAGVDVLAFRTKHGDGTYFDEASNEYAVDAGLIGLVPYDIAVQTDDDIPFVYPVTFYVDTVCMSDGKGLLTFGQINIETEDNFD